MKLFLFFTLAVIKSMKIVSISLGVHLVKMIKIKLWSCFSSGDIDLKTALLILQNKI
jgi:hypothetical protein